MHEEELEVPVEEGLVVRWGEVFAVAVDDEPLLTGSFALCE